MRNTTGTAGRTAVAASLMAVAAWTNVVRGQVIDVPLERENLLALQEELPTPAEIIERHIEATGGRAAYERLRTRRVVGTLQQGDQAANRIVIMSRPSHDRHVELHGSGGGVRRFITNRDESWTYEGDTVVAAGGEQRAQEILRAAYDVLLDWERVFPLARTMGVESVGGRPSYRVRLLTDDCHEIVLYFDKESGRNVRKVEDIAYAGQVIRADATYTEYKEFDGVAMPTRSRRVLDTGGGRSVQVFVTETVEHNVELADELFETPFELRGADATG